VNGIGLLTSSFDTTHTAKKKKTDSSPASTPTHPSRSTMPRRRDDLLYDFSLVVASASTGQ
jgi:hypothetical protein